MSTKNLSELSREEKRKLIYFNSDENVLSDLATDPDYYIRELVAKDIRTPKNKLLILASDDAWCVKIHVIKNPNTPKDALEILSHDKDSFIADMAIKILEQNR